MAYVPGRAELRASWIEEEIHRATCILELYLRQEDCAVSSGSGRAEEVAFRHRSERFLATLDTLEVADGTSIRPCGEVCREVCDSIVALFADLTRRVTVKTQFETLTLSSYRRNALALGCLAFVTSALRWSLANDRRRSLNLSLKKNGDGYAVARIEDDGFDLQCREDRGTERIATSLGTLLEAETVYRRLETGGTEIELLFPYVMLRSLG
jgi:hypothetical protein